ncbi:MAG: hypothetical protein LAT84_10030 [Balneolia bacterium]|nr:hypothetical protein [Balneolia bacterium]
MTSSNSFPFSWFLFAGFLFTVALAACNTVDTDFKRDNPIDPVLPKIEILSPENEFINHHNDTLFVEIQVQDVNSPLDELEINVSSHRDGFLTSVRPNSSGYANINLTGLSISTHYIKAEATNTLGNTQADSVFVRNNAAPAVNMLTAEFVEGFYNELTWEQSPDDEFQYYDLYKINSLGASRNIARITDRGATTYRHPAPIDSLTTYFIKTSSTFYQTPHTGRSKDIHRPAFFGMQGAQFFSAIHYPNIPVIIVNKRVTSFFHKLIAYNYVRNEIIAADIPDGSRILQMAAGKNGSVHEVYITKAVNPGRLYIYDALTMELIEYINSAWPISQLFTDNSGNLIRRSNNLIHVSGRNEFPAFNSQVTINSYNATISVSGESNEIYHRTLGHTRQVRHMHYDNNGNVSGLNGPYSGLDFSGATVIHPNGDYLVTSSQAKIIDKAPSLEHLETLKLNASYIGFTFGRTGDILFALDSRGWVDVYENLSLTDHIEVDMIPERIFYNDGTIVLFGKSKHLSGNHRDYYGVAAIPVNY